MKIQGAVKKETIFITAGTLLACVVVILVFFVLHRIMPKSVPFGYPVILGALCGGLVASLNFFWMAMTVQKITKAAAEDAEAAARAKAKAAAESPQTQEGEDSGDDDEVHISPEVSERAYSTMKLSFRCRMLMQLVWVILAITLPVFQFAAGIIPLFLPSLLIKARGLITGTQNLP